MVNIWVRQSHKYRILRENAVLSQIWLICEILACYLEQVNVMRMHLRCGKSNEDKTKDGI